MSISPEQQAEVFKLWLTGEPAKTHVLESLCDVLARTDRGSMVLLFMDCVKDSHQAIERGAFPNPPDWLFSTSSFLSLARWWDADGVPETPFKRNVLLAMLRAMVQNLKGGPLASVEDATARAILDELRKHGRR
mgnify:CR=1 FL=1